MVIPLAFALLLQIQVSLTSFEGVGAVPREEVALVFAEASNYYREAGLAVNLVRHKRRPVACLKYSKDPFLVLFQLQCFMRHTARHRHALTYAVAPPIINSGAWWLGGLARQICGPRSLAAGNATPDDLSLSAVIMAHELGHLLGAAHEEVLGSLMNPSAAQDFYLTRLAPRITPQSLQRISACLLRRR